jgi:hypothetical protein
MKNLDYLVKYAMDNAWCSPEQDTQYIIKPAKISRDGGVRKETKVLARYVDLPDATSFWNMYQIGGIHPLILGLFPATDQWTTLAYTSNLFKMVVDIYTDDGIQLPRFQTYYKYNEDKNLILAVKRNDKIPFDFNKGEVFLRVYTNYYFKSLQANQAQDIIDVRGGVFTSIPDILAFQTTFDNYKNLPGYVYGFVNGFKVDTIDLNSVKIGDVAEFVYDSSIYKIVDFKVDNLNDFHSTLDKKKKFLLHYSGADNGTIDYQDDVDVFILQPLGGTRHKGLYYHKNSKDALRSITHRDYTVCAGYIDRYGSKLQATGVSPNPVKMGELYVRLHIRKSGSHRPLVFENNRIHELYKLQEVDILRAFLGIDSNVSNWRADVLEESAYSQLLGMPIGKLNNDLVRDAFGYNATSKIIGDTPSAVYDFTAKKTADVPYGLQTGCTAYEYDQNGHLLGWYIHDVGDKYFCTNSNAKNVEFISGRGGDYLDEYYNSRNMSVEDKNDFRVYECKITNGVADNVFVDVTGNPAKYKYENGRVVWLEPSISSYSLVRTNARFLALDTLVMGQNGQLNLSITHLQKRGPNWSTWVMHVPMGELDIFLNDRPLVRDVDYVFKFPEIYINNKEYLVNPDTTMQKVHIRFTGFCTKDLKVRVEDDRGFVDYGMLSNNNKFDLRDDKVLRIVVDGSLKTRADLTFYETHSGVSVINALNGKPYSIRDIVVPTRGLVNGDTYNYRDSSQAIDKVVSDYMTLKIPQPSPPGPTAVQSRYAVFSPFSNKIIYDISRGNLVIADKVYSDQEVLKTLKTYEYLLKFDPTQEEQAVDDRYVIVHPHNLGLVVPLTVTQYRFVEKAVKLYLKSLVTLSPFVTMN